jgi:phosphatidylglycerol:prolipoprotein diacylglycerol transferase
MNCVPYGIPIGPLCLRYYGILIMTGAVLAGVLGARLLKEMDEDPEIVWDGLIWLLVFGLVGARIYHIFTPSKSLIAQGIDTQYYLTHPLSILTTWRGGLGMPGAIIGGVFGIYVFARRRGLNMGKLLDAAAPGVALAQAIGRWGNFINQELYGPPTDLPWGIYIRPENRLSGYESFERFHPLFLYESLWNLGNALLLLWLWRRYGERLQKGDLFIVYLITYPIGRFLLEYLRLDYVPVWGGANLNQLVMLAVAVVSAAALFLRHRSAATSA